MKKDRWYPIIILAVCLLTYSPTLRYFFVNDDLMWLSIAKEAHSDLSNIFNLTYFHEFRPFTALTFLINYYISGVDPMGYHLFNLILHGINSVLVFFILKKVTGNWETALAASLIFSVSASHFGSVTWISGRTALLGAFFIFLGFISFMEGGRGRALSLLFYSLSLLSVEYTFVFPFIILAYLLLFDREKKGVDSFKISSPFFVIMAIFIIFQYGLQSEVTSQYSVPEYRNPQVVDSGFITQNLFHALVILWMPFKFRKYYLPPPISYTVQLIILATIYLIGASLYRLSKGSREERFAILWIYINIIPFIFLTNYIFPRHLYIAAFGWSILLTLALNWVKLKFKFITPGLKSLALVTIIMAGATFNITEGNDSFNGESTREIVENLKGVYPDVGPDTTVVLVGFPLDSWVMSYIFDVFGKGAQTVYAIDRNDAPAFENSLKGNKSVFLYYNEGKIIEESFQ